MIPKIDVVVENFAPGVIAEMGFGYEALKKINPRIIMCSISVAGQTGPLSYKPGYDYMGAALAGITDQLGEPDRAPIVPPMAIGDISTGVAAAMAVGFALLHRERTGEGQMLDASLIDTYFHMHELSVPVVSLRPGKFEPKRSGAMHPTGAPCGVYKANDGYVLLIVQQHEMRRLLRAMERPDLPTDARFKTNARGSRTTRRCARLSKDGCELSRSRRRASPLLDRERVPCAPVLKLAEAMAHPHLRGRKTVRRVNDAAIGEFDIPGMPVKFSAWPDRTDVKASRMGADNAAIVGELAELSPADIDALARAGVLIAAPAPIPPAPS